jgi:hypothetical protein
MECCRNGEREKSQLGKDFIMKPTLTNGPNGFLGWRNALKRK